jgi:hypothetical protein
MFARNLGLDRRIEMRRAFPAARRGQRQFRRTPLRLAAQREQQRYQFHRRIGFPTAQDLGDPRAFAGNGDGGDPPGFDSQPQPHAAGIDGPTHASGKRRVNSAPPLGWLSAASLPPWRSTMP